MAGPTYPAEDGPRWSAIPHAGVAATLLVFLGCTQTSVEPVAVASIAISPERFTTLVSDEMPLSLEIRDLDGNPLSRPDVVWSSLNPAVATVTSEGVVQAVSPGQVLITAKVEGAVGTAQATIEARPETRLSPGSLDLSGTAGSGAIQAAIRVTNQGGGTLDDLSVRVTEGGDWIDATLAGGKAPTDLNLSVRPNSLSPGTYRGRVEVRSDHGSRTATINLQVRPKPQDPDEKDDSGSDDSGNTGNSGNSDDEDPAKPSKLEAEEDGQSRIDLEWE
ncbi:MAG: hypothetical protein HKO53_14405, partial [Gemmatimonadetes bacterium]|nr:hypothetical protein [Gemmatimonadota bacterium]